MEISGLRLNTIRHTFEFNRHTKLTEIRRRNDDLKFGRGSVNDLGGPALTLQKTGGVHFELAGRPLLQQGGGRWAGRGKKIHWKIGIRKKRKQKA